MHTLTNVFGGLADSTARPDVPLSRTRISDYVPPKLWWSFTSQKKKKDLVFLQNPSKLHTMNTDISHKLLEDYTFGVSSPYTSTQHLQQMKSLNQDHSFPQQQVS